MTKFSQGHPANSGENFENECQERITATKLITQFWGCYTNSRRGSPKQQKFAMNKALEQKLIGPLEESHTEEQSPKAVL